MRSLVAKSQRRFVCHHLNYPELELFGTDGTFRSQASILQAKLSLFVDAAVRSCFYVESEAARSSTTLQIPLNDWKAEKITQSQHRRLDSTSPGRHADSSVQRSVKEKERSDCTGMMTKVF